MGRDWDGYVHFAWQTPGRGTSEGFLATSGQELLGMSTYRLGLGATTRLGALQGALALTHLGPRPEQTAASFATSLPESRRAPARNLLDASLTWPDPLPGLVPGLEVQVALHNLGAARLELVQPYYGGHAPLPTGDREATLTLRWRF